MENFSLGLVVELGYMFLKMGRIIMGNLYIRRFMGMAVCII